jgi:glucose/arabinose dehydrogenase
MDRRTLLKAAAGTPVAAALVAAGFDPASAVGPGRTLVSGLDIPWGLDFLPDRSALLTERDSAQVLRVGRHGRSRVIGTVPGVAPAGEGGLLGLAVSPRFRRDHRVYVYFSTPTDNRVAWMPYVDGRLGSPTPIVTGIPRGTIHNGGSLLFTRSGALLIGCGDTGHREYAQDVNALGGKILRVDRNGHALRTNPFVGRDGDDRILTYGHRNPQGLAQRDKDHAIWSAELGQDTFDELNHIHAGADYGWPVVEGTDGPGGFADPLAQWAPADCSPSGVAIAKDRAWIGGLRGQSLWSVRLNGRHRGTKQRHLQGAYGRIRNVKHAPDGSLWFTTSNGGNADRLVRVGI